MFGAHQPHTRVAVGVFALMSSWLFAFAMTQSSDEAAMSSNFARSEVEAARAAGYLYTNPGTTYKWFRGDGTPLANAGYRPTSSGAFPPALSLSRRPGMLQDMKQGPVTDG